MENTQWTDLLQLFITVKELHLSDSIAQRVARLAPAPKELSMEGVTGVMPVLRNIFLVEFEPSWPTEDAMEQFVIARQLFGCPVAVYYRGRRGWVTIPHRQEYLVPIPPSAPRMPFRKLRF